MSSSGEIWVLNKIAELADRCGVSPTVADISLKLHFPDDDSYYYTLTAGDGDAETPEEQEKVLKVNSLLGMDETGFRRAKNLREIEEIVDQALSLAPRSRVR